MIAIQIHASHKPLNFSKNTNSSEIIQSMKLSNYILRLPTNIELRSLKILYTEQRKFVLKKFTSKAPQKRKQKRETISQLIKSSRFR